MDGLGGKIAIIVGASRGLGRAIAITFAREDVDVVLAARTQSDLERVSDTIRSFGGRAWAVRTDATAEDDANHLVNETLAKFGQIDVLVNCVGVALIKPTVEMTMEDWGRVLNTNLTAVFLTSRAVLPVMVKQGGGHIINISSRIAQVGAPQITAYCAAKAGVIGFSQSLAKEVKSHGIKVSVICPGPMDTPMRWEATPDFSPERVLNPERVAELAVLVASQADVAMDTITLTSLKY